MNKVVLCIMDGVGIAKDSKGNAFERANKPTYDKLIKEYPNSLVEASGELVGLPEGQMGNSEVGHMNIGAGRIVYQPLQLINEKIKNKEYYENKKFKEVFEHTKNNNSNLHILGLLSDGGIHSHIRHLMALIDSAKNNNIKNVYLHIFLDGRDTLPKSAIKYLEMIESKLDSNVKIASISGRYYAMDRDNRYERVKLAYDAIMGNEAPLKEDYKKAIEESYNNNEADEFVKPFIVNKNGGINNNDGIILFNYRPDRGREIGSAISNPKFDGFDTKKLNYIKMVTMMPLSNEVISTPAFTNETLDNTLGEYLANNNVTQLRIAETEKYAHVTYFFDGGIEKDLKGCKRILVPSPKVATYDMAPEMSAEKITDELLNVIEDYEVVILNYANGDMVGHTGNIEAAIKSVEVMDKCLNKLYEKTKEIGSTLIVTADHGNCEYMLDAKGNTITSHSTNKVPFIVTKDLKLNNGKLADIAPTILELINLKQPSSMTGKSLIK